MWTNLWYIFFHGNGEFTRWLCVFLSAGILWQIVYRQRSIETWWRARCCLRFCKKTLLRWINNISQLLRKIPVAFLLLFFLRLKTDWWPPTADVTSGFPAKIHSTAEVADNFPALTASWQSQISNPIPTRVAISVSNVCYEVKQD